jgi:hypothetical protein
MQEYCWPSHEQCQEASIRKRFAIMRSTWIAVLVSGVVILSISSCATVPTEPLASGELRLLSIHIPERGEIRVNIPFVVNINFEANGKPDIRTACLFFSFDGPYCFKVTDVDYGSPGTIKILVRAKNSGSQALESYVYYIKDGKVQPTNIVNCNVRVIP